MSDLKNIQNVKNVSHDLISRQDAIDALGEAPEVWTESPEEFAELNQWEMDVTAIKAVPPATCDDCIWHVCNYNKVDWDRENDYISRQAVIDAVREAQEWFGAKETSEDCSAFEACEEIIEAINKIPYADMRGGES